MPKFGLIFFSIFIHAYTLFILQQWNELTHALDWAWLRHSTLETKQQYPPISQGGFVIQPSPPFTGFQHKDDFLSMSVFVDQLVSMVSGIEH